MHYQLKMQNEIQETRRISKEQLISDKRALE